MDMTDLTFDELALLAQGHARIDVPCPICSHKRKPAHRRHKVLRIWDDGQLLTYNCAHCGIHGWARDGGQASAQPVRALKPAPREVDRSDLARFLWASSKSMEGTPVEAYLMARRCPLVSPSLRYLPARGSHPHAMVAQFCPTGVHLTKLSPNGRSKAGTGKDKIMIGPSMGYPIRVYDPDEREELVITEGIEDAASFAVAMGWPAWAAGSAGRIAAVVPPHGRVYVAVDDDEAGLRALEQAQTVRDVIAIQVGKIFKGMDANRLLSSYGADMLVAVVEHADVQYAYERGEIKRAAWERSLKWVEEVTG